jgi:hypothetical protein
MCSEFCPTQYTHISTTQNTMLHAPFWKEKNAIGNQHMYASFGISSDPNKINNNPLSYRQFD